VPEHIRSDNGSEFTAKCVREWLGRVGGKTLFIEPGSPWENGYVESFNGKLRADLLEREAFDTLLEAKVLMKRLMRPTDTNERSFATAANVRLTRRLITGSHSSPGQVVLEVVAASLGLSCPGP
jgi:transposase InsO family protein